MWSRELSHTDCLKMFLGEVSRPRTRVGRGGRLLIPDPWNKHNTGERVNPGPEQVAVVDYLVPHPWTNHNTLECESALSLEPEHVAVVHCIIPHHLNQPQHVFNSHKKTKHHIVQDSSGWRSSRNTTYIRVGNPSENLQ